MDLLTTELGRTVAACRLSESGEPESGCRAAVELENFVLGAGEADLQLFDFTESALLFGVNDSGVQVVPNLAEPTPLTRIRTQKRTSCACIRCPMCNINPKVLFRLDEIEKDLLDRRARAKTGSVRLKA